MSIAQTHGLLIGDDEVQSESTLQLIDPSTGVAFAEVASPSERDVAAAVSVARKCFDDNWSQWTPVERAQCLGEAAAAIREAADDLALLDALDAVPLGMARADALTAARYFEFYAGIADKFGADTIPLGLDFVNYMVRAPWGVRRHFSVQRAALDRGTEHCPGACRR